MYHNYMTVQTLLSTTAFAQSYNYDTTLPTFGHKTVTEGVKYNDENLLLILRVTVKARLYVGWIIKTEILGVTVLMITNFVQTNLRQFYIKTQCLIMIPV